MLVRICCPCIRQNPIYKNVRCNRYLGEVDGRYHFKCDRCKGVIEGDTREGWVKIIHPPEKFWRSEIDLNRFVLLRFLFCRKGGTHG